MTTFIGYSNGKYRVRFQGGLVYDFDSAVGAKIAIDTGDPAGYGEPVFKISGPFRYRVIDAQGRIVCLTNDRAAMAWKGFAVEINLRVIDGGKQ